MRKLIVFTLAIIAIVWGLTVGLKRVPIEEASEENNVVETVSENYIDELNLPLIEVDTLNPLKTNNSQVISILSFIYEPLISFKSDESLEKVLLDDFAKLDSNTWIIKLRENVLWHNGRKFTADDVVYTFNTLLNNNLIYSANVSNIKEIIKLDEHSIKIILEQGDDYFIGKLNFPIMSQVEENRLVGTGPYQYEKEDKEGNVVLEFNKSWWKESSAKLQKINLYKYTSYGEAIKAFKSAKIDIIVTNMSKWKGKFGTIGLNAYSFENSEFEVIIPNCNNLALAENSVRRAILQAISRENIINSVYDDNATTCDIPIHTNSKNSINSAEYDLEKAKQILINAGWVQNGNSWQKVINGKNQILNFNLLVNSENEEKIQVAEKIKEDLLELGININIKKTSKEDLIKALLEDKFELVLTSIDVKNEFFIQEQIKKDSSKNYSNYSSKEIQKIIEEMASNTEADEDKMYSLAQAYKNDAPYIGLYFKTSTILTNKSVKGNFEPTWSNYFRNITSFCK